LLSVALLVLAATPAQAGWTAGAPHGVPFGQLFGDPGSPTRAYLLGPASLYVTDDRGASWVARSLPSSNGIDSLAAFAGPPSLLVAIDRTGAVWHSTDQARSWSAIGCCALAVDAAGPALMIGNGYRGSTDFTRSVDGGVTWTPIATPPYVTQDLAFAIAPGGVVFAWTYTGVTYRSDDLGSTWQVITGIPEGAIVPAPGIVGSLWAGGLHSVDGGATWERPAPLVPGCSADAVLGADPLVVWLTGFCSAARSLDGGVTWELAALPDGGSGPVLVGAVLDGGMAALGMGSSGPWLLEPGQEPVYRPDGLPAMAYGPLLADPLVPGSAYSGTFTTSDRGASWRPVWTYWPQSIARVAGRVITDGTESRPAAGGAPTALLDDRGATASDPLGRRAWILGPAGLRSTVDGVHLTTPGAHGLLDYGQSDSSEVPLLAAGGDAATVIATFYRWPGTVEVSHDGGRTFRARTLPVDYADGLSVDARDGRLLLVLARGRLYRSLDAGAHFRRVRSGIVATAVDPRRRGVWYAATATRLEWTQDAGRTWHLLARPPGGRTSALSAGAGRLWALTGSLLSSMALPGARR
jgi:hypothetical protein